MPQHKVLIRRCESYDPERIRRIVRDGMEELGVRPAGKVLLKPNVVMAGEEVFTHAFTRGEFLDGVIAAVRDTADDGAEIAVGERSGITVPTRFNFRSAGYGEVMRRHGVRCHHFDEERQVPVTLRNDDRLRDRVFVPRPVAECNTFINLPKFKAHPWCRLTLSLKNYIGLQDDRHRLVDHNLYLERKIADLQEIVTSSFIAVDGIVAGQNMMLTPTPFALGAIVMGTNSCAVDTVGCHMVRVNPADLVHLRLTAERGLGPMDLEEIEIGGDYPLEEVQARTAGFQFRLERIDRYFDANSPLSCRVGTFPASHSADYCWGGCPGALQEAMHILRGFDPEVDRKMGRLRYVVGEVDGPLKLAPDERVIFAGRCTRWEGRIDGERVRIEGSYLSPGQVDEGRTTGNDMLRKTMATLWNVLRNRTSRWVHVPGCPVSVADHVHYLSFLGGVRNPNFDPRLVVPLNVAYGRMRWGRFMNAVRR